MSCFEQTDKNDTVPFLTAFEGTQFRNCITKFSTWIPTLRGNLEESAFRQLSNKLMNFDGARNVDLSAIARVQH